MSLKYKFESTIKVKIDYKYGQMDGKAQRACKSFY